jgi:hypothetical protein
MEQLMQSAGRIENNPEVAIEVDPAKGLGDKGAAGDEPSRQ